MSREKTRFASREPKVMIMDITPAIAREMLQYNTQNRPVRQEALNSYKETIASGGFDFTNASIGFDSDGYLIDGQHRLMAIVETGVALKMVVVLGANQSVYLDRGARRTVTDNLAITNKKEYSQIVVAAINLMWKIHTGLHKSLDERKIAIGYDLIRQDVESAATAPIFRKSQKKGTASYTSDYMAAMMMLLVSRKYPVDAIVEMNALYRDGYSSNPTQSDAVVLQQRTIYLAQQPPFDRGSTGRTKQTVERCETFLTAMLAYLEGNKRPKSLAQARDFIKDSMGPWFELIDDEFSKARAALAARTAAQAADDPVPAQE